MSFLRPSVPTSVCCLELTVKAGPSELLSLLVSESIPDIIAGSLASVPSVLGASLLGVLSFTVGTPGWRFRGNTGTFLFSPTGIFFGGPGATFLSLGTALVVFKRNGPRTFGFLGNVGF